MPAPRAARTAMPLMAAAGLLLALTGCSSDSVMDLEVGDCLSSDDLSGTEISSVETVECTQPHDAEVFADLTFDDGDYPGMETVRADAEAHCREEFRSFVGLDYESSEIFFTAMYPTQDSWDQAKDRTALCILIAPEDVTGSLEGANR